MRREEPTTIEVTTQRGRNSTLARIQSEITENLRDAAEVAYQKLEKYFNISSDYCIASVVLDPRHKLDFYNEDGRSEAENYQQRTEIHRPIKDLYKEQYLSTEEIIPDVHEAKQISKIFKKRKVNTTCQLQRYLFEYPSAEPAVDPLTWWARTEHWSDQAHH